MMRTALVASVFITLAGAALFILYKKRFEQGTSGGDEVAVLMAVEDIPLGAVVTEKMLGVRTIRQAHVESRHVRVSDMARVLGTRVSMELKANESLLWSDLAAQTGDRRDLSALVKSGTRAITIQTEATSTFGGLLRPGDHVDVFLTAAADPSRRARATVPLLQNALVLAVGGDTGDADAAHAPSVADTRVTLGVGLSQAQALALAQDRGRLTLALRNPDDTAILPDLRVTTFATVLDPEPAR